MLDSTPDFILIPLTKGQSAIVDCEDGDLAQFKWCAMRLPSYHDNQSFMACRNVVEPSGKRKLQLMHRLILSRILERDLTSKEEVDHVDGNPLNNRRSNLRLANRVQNAANQPKRRNNSSGFKGVSYHRKANKWVARIQIYGKDKYLGLFATAELAHDAYCKAAKEAFGEFANLSAGNREE